jgi:collagenase-like PrtC family protease
MKGALELVCPAGTPAAFHAAVAAGADAIYCGFRDETNARNFPGLNFDRAELRAAIALANERQVKVLVAVNTYPQAGNPGPWHSAIDDAAAAGAWAVIVADMGLAAYVARHHPQLRLHLSVQAAASTPDAIRYYCEAFGVKRVVLPRVLTIPQIAAINSAVECETEVFAYGGLCVMAEGRCALSSYATGQSPNINGVCSPASHVSYSQKGEELVSRLGDYTINVFGPGEEAGYPTLCKGRFSVREQPSYIFEDPVSLNAAALLPQFVKAGVTAIKLEGRQRGRAYIRQIVTAFRQAIDSLEKTGAARIEDLGSLSEGGSVTEGAYRKTWR